MNRFLTLIGASLVAASAAGAQTTSQEAILGASGDPVYSLQVRGANSVVYNCRPEVVTIDGVQARQCVTAGSGGLFEAGNGVAAGGAAAAAALVIIAIAANDSSTTTTTTN